jgi:hypothetical protein
MSKVKKLDLTTDENAPELQEDAAPVETWPEPALEERPGLRIVHEEVAPGVWRDYVIKPGVA